MASKNKEKDLILGILLKSKNYEKDILVISQELKLDYNDCYVLCEDLIEQEFAYSHKAPQSASANKNKTLKLTPRGISYIREGGFKKSAKDAFFKTLSNFIIPISSLIVSALALYFTNSDRIKQEKKWQALNRPRMVITEMKIPTWKTFNSARELLNYHWGYSIPYTCNTEAGQCSISTYLIAFDHEKRWLYEK